MFDTLKRLYLRGDLSTAKLEKAVEKGWITENQKIQIMTFS